METDRPRVYECRKCQAKWRTERQRDLCCTGGVETDRPADPIVAAVQADLEARSRLGMEKYGVGLDRGDLSLRDWLVHQYEELLDAACYTKAAIVRMDRADGPTDPAISPTS